MRDAGAPPAVLPYYRAALAALRHLEARRPTGRRFGADADARWSSFRGDLTTADRIDLLVRDADAEWPGALGARTVFDLRATAEDEPFGADWAPLDPIDAEELWRAALSSALPEDTRAALEAVASAWGVRLAWPAPPRVEPADRLVLVGPSAIASTILAFSAGASLDWAAQVVCVATPPAHRQLAALGGALLTATKPTVILTAASVKPAAPTTPLRLVLSEDTGAADAAFARTILGGPAGGARD